MIEVLQIVGTERPDTSYDLPESITFDRVDAVICVLPESSYCVVHDTFFLTFVLAFNCWLRCYTWIRQSQEPLLRISMMMHVPTARIMSIMISSLRLIAKHP